jgi:hypothetical protein
MYSFRHCAAVIFLFAVLVSVGKANDGEWQLVGSPNVIGTIEDIAIGYNNLDERFIFAATSTMEGMMLEKVMLTKMFSLKRRILLSVGHWYLKNPSLTIPL